jgi:hypothetical protein
MINKGPKGWLLITHLFFQLKELLILFERLFLKIATIFKVFDMRILHNPRDFMNVADIFDEMSRQAHLVAEIARG